METHLFQWGTNNVCVALLYLSSISLWHSEFIGVLSEQTPMHLYVISPPLSRSHLVNHCITMLLARCSNIAEFSHLSWYFAQRPPSCVWVSPSTQAQQFGLMWSDTTVFHFAWIMCSLPFSFVTIYHFLKSSAQNLSPSVTLTLKGSLLINTYI